MYWSEKTASYYKRCQPSCVFYTRQNTVCGKPAVGIYVRRSNPGELAPVCLAHRDEAAYDGDGPVYNLVPVELEVE